MSIGFSPKRRIPHTRIRGFLARLALLDRQRPRTCDTRDVIAQRRRLAADLKAAWRRREQRP